MKDCMNYNKEDSNVKKIYNSNTITSALIKFFTAMGR